MTELFALGLDLFVLDDAQVLARIKEITTGGGISIGRKAQQLDLIRAQDAFKIVALLHGKKDAKESGLDDLAGPTPESILRPSPHIVRPSSPPPFEMPVSVNEFLSYVDRGQSKRQHEEADESEGSDPRENSEFRVLGQGEGKP